MRAKIYDVPRRIVETAGRSYGILNYDRDNAYPQRVRALMADSPRAVSIRRVYQRFITGDGFTDRNYWKAVVNGDGLTMDALVRRLDNDLSHHGAFALHVNWDLNYKITEYRHVPFEHCRLPYEENHEKQGMMALYDDWARWKRSRIYMEHIHWLDLFNPDPNVIAAQVEKAGGWDRYNGQLLYVSLDDTARYPLSPFDAALEDIDTHAQLKQYNNNLVRKEFNPSVVLVTYGRTEAAPGVAAAPSVANEVAAFMGAERNGKLMHMEVDSAEQKPEFIPVPQNDADKKYTNLNEDVKENIRAVAMIPKVLVGDLLPGKLSTAQEVQDATVFYNWLTLDPRRLKEETFQRLHAHWHRPEDNAAGDFSIKEATFNYPSPAMVTDHNQQPPINPPDPQP